MPDWCNNTLQIYGNSQQLNKLPWKKDNDFLLQSLIPFPTDKTPTEKYEWSILNWGVKWDCFISITDRSDDFLELQFATPWTSPHEGIDTVASMFPNLTFEMNSSESGCDWREYCCWENGNLAQKTTSTFYRQDPLKCPDCGEDYHPEIDLDGDISYSECFNCGWCS